jgi:hypothetical protein
MAQNNQGQIPIRLDVRFGSKADIADYEDVIGSTFSRFHHRRFALPQRFVTGKIGK